MSQRGGGSGPHDDDLDDEDAGQNRAPERHLRQPEARPIAPYDPYRSATSESSRRPTRNVAADTTAPPPRAATRRGTNDPFLPDDDPLNAEAWQLDLDEVEVFDEEFEAPRPEPTREARPPRRRRPPGSAQSRAAESGTGVRRGPRRASAPASSMRDRLPRGGVSISVPRMVTGSSLFADQTAITLLGINLISIVLMVLVFAVRLGGLPDAIVLHLDAAGNPDRWGPPTVLWRLPLMAFFMTVMFGVVAWFLHPIDRFAARFALGAAAVAQLVIWVAVIQHLFIG